MKRITRKDSALGEPVLSEEEVRAIERELKQERANKRLESKKQKELVEKNIVLESEKELELANKSIEEATAELLSSTRNDELNNTLNDTIFENPGDIVLINSLTELNSELNESFKSLDINTLQNSAFFAPIIKIEPVEEIIEADIEQVEEPIMAEFPFTNFHKSIPEFSGTISDLNRFLACCDLFNTELTTDLHRATFLKFLVKKFSGRAFDFYSRQVWVSWSELKDALKKYFSTSQSFEGYQMQLSKQRQGALDVKKFAEKIQEILLEMNRISNEITVENQTGTQFFKAQNEKLAIKSFINGLTEPIRGYLKSQSFVDLHAAIKSAIELESDEYLNKNINNLVINEPQIRNMTCFKCNKIGHTANFCRGKQNNFNRNNFNQNNFNRNNLNRNNFQRNFANNNFRNNRINNKVTCFRCHKVGHTVPNCRVNLNGNSNLNSNTNANINPNSNFNSNGSNRNMNGNGTRGRPRENNYSSSFSRNNIRGVENNRNPSAFVPDRNRQQGYFNRNANIVQAKNEIEQTAELDNACLDLIAM